jgi:hypothetical protein
MSYISLQKTTLGLILLVAMITNALASSSVTNNPTTQPSSPLSNPQSKAIEFARQAGAIAGIAQACGQNLTDFSARIAEAINKLSSNPSDQAGAMLVYQQISQEAQMAERKNQTIPCMKVLQDFRSLPIMQADYEAKVIAQLDPSGP